MEAGTGDANAGLWIPTDVRKPTEGFGANGKPRNADLSNRSSSEANAKRDRRNRGIIQKENSRVMYKLNLSFLPFPLNLLIPAEKRVIMQETTAIAVRFP